MPSFDVVSEVDLHQLTNAVDQARRVVDTRFDFKGVDASFEQDKFVVLISADAEFQVDQMVDMLRGTLIKCGIDPLAMEVGEARASGKLVKQGVSLRNGLETDLCRTIVKKIKEAKLKVAPVVQGGPLSLLAVARSLSGRDEVLWVTSPYQEQWLKDDGVLKNPLRMKQGSLVAESCEIDETKFQVKRIAQVESTTKEK